MPPVWTPEAAKPNFVKKFSKTLCSIPKKNKLPPVGWQLSEP
jgi:hypothetical protein